MLTSSPYICLELGLVLFMVAFGWREWRTSGILSKPIVRAAAGLIGLWFFVDQAAFRLGLWDFPTGGTWRFRFLGLPLEEYILFLLHPIICLVLIRPARART